MLCDLLEFYETDQITLFQTFCATGVTNAIDAIFKEVVKQWPAITMSQELKQITLNDLKPSLYKSVTFFLVLPLFLDSDDTLEIHSPKN